MNAFERGLGNFVVKWRWFFIVATILIVAVAASGVRFLTFNKDSRVFFSEENPQLQALEALENTFTKENNVLFVITNDEGNVFERETLAALEELTESSWQVPYSNRVDSLANFQHTYAEEDDLIVENLFEDALDLSDADMERIREVALSEILLVNRLVSPSGHVTGVNINILLPGESSDEIEETAKFAYKLADEFREKHPELELHVTGGIMFDYGFSVLTKDDMRKLIPLMFVVLVVLVGLFLRSIAGTVGALLIILMSMATGLGLAGWLGFEMTSASAMSPPIILTLAVADSVHLMVTMFQQMRGGKTKHEAIAESVRINLQPVFLTSVTTAIGFLSMNVSDAPPFRDMGNIVAMGVMAALVYSIFFLPALMAVIPVRVRAKRSDTNCRSCAQIAEFVIKRRTPVFWGSLLMVLLLSLGVFRVELDDDWIAYFGERYEIRTSTDFVIENLAGMDVIEYALESGEPGGISNPEYLATVEAFANWYREQPKVHHVYSFTDTMKRLNMNMHGDDEAYLRVPENRELAAQYLLLYEMSLPFGLDLNNRINVDKSSTRMVVSMRAASTREILEMDSRAREWLVENAPEYMVCNASGMSMIWAHISKRNINNMLIGSFGALFLISFILIAALRSLKIGLVSLVPNLVPALMGVGLWGMLFQTVGLGLSVVVSLTLGIVVDDTIHFLSKYLRARREYAKNPADAIRFAFDTVGTALWVTTFVLVAGFSVLCFSGFKMNSDMGLSTAITISLALAMDFLLLPTLLMKVEGVPENASESDTSAAAVAVDGDGGVA